jgi:hypothetical protein
MIRDQGQLGRPGRHRVDAVEERMADEDVIDELRAAVQHPAEAAILRQDARRKVPRPLRVTEVRLLEAARVDLRARGPSRI